MNYLRQRATTTHKNRIEKGTADPIFMLIVLVVIVLIALASLAIRKSIVPLFQDRQVSAAGPALSQDAQAAIAGVSAFYTIDYTEPEGAWVDRMCAAATEEGCTLAKGYLAAAVHTTAEKYFVQTGCTVLPVELVEDDQDRMLRIWKTQVTLSNPWPAIKQPLTVYVAVEYDSALRKWLMQHILFEQETTKYIATATP